MNHRSNLIISESKMKKKIKWQLFIFNSVVNISKLKDVQYFKHDFNKNKNKSN